MIFIFKQKKIAKPDGKKTKDLVKTDGPNKLIEENRDPDSNKLVNYKLLI